MTAAEIVGVGERRALTRIAAALDAGGVVGFPTDTVYGIGARIDRADAIDAIFEMKSRPGDLALPVLVGTDRQARALATSWPKSARDLSARWWPGALTLVVATDTGLARHLGGLDTIGIRRPGSDFVRRLCRRVGPLAVTSANPHGTPPAATAAEVVAMFGTTALAMVVDAGECHGTPSTVVDCTSSPPSCRREGGIPWSWIEAALR